MRLIIEAAIDLFEHGYDFKPPLKEVHTAVAPKELKDAPKGSKDPNFGDRAPWGRMLGFKSNLRHHVKVDGSESTQPISGDRVDYINKVFAGWGFCERRPRLRERPLEWLPALNEILSNLIEALNKHKAEPASHIGAAGAPTRSAHGTAKIVGPLPARLLGFVGREDDLTIVEELFLAATFHRAAVVGPPGGGKSSLACELTYRRMDHYSGICWCSSTSRVELLTSLEALAFEVCPDVPMQISLETRARAALERVANIDGRWLFVYDDAPDPNAILDLLPRANVDVLITSRFVHWNNLASVYEVPLFPIEDAASVLLRSRQGPKETAKDLAIALGGLPLAVDHARAFCERFRMSYSKYEQEIAGLIKLRPRGHQYPNSVFSTFTLAIDAAARECPAAEVVSAILSVCGTAPIPIEAFLGNAELALERRQALGAMSEVSLVKWSAWEGGADAVVVHSLIQRVAFERATGSGFIKWVVNELASWLIENYPSNSAYDPSTWKICESLNPHILALSAVKPQPTFWLWGEVLGRLATYYQIRGLQDEREAVLRQGLDASLRIHGEHNEITAWRMDALSALEKEKGNINEAIAFSERALAIKTLRLGGSNSMTARTAADLAHLYADNGRRDRAREILENSLQATVRTRGNDSEAVAARLQGMADFIGEENPVEGIDLYERAAAIYDASRIANDLRVAYCCYSIGALERSLDNLDRAAEFYGKALTIFEGARPEEDSVDTAAALLRVGEIEWLRERYEEALLPAKRAADMCERLITSQSEEYAPVIRLLVVTLVKLGRYVEAEQRLGSLLEVHQSYYGKSGRSTIALVEAKALLLDETMGQEAGDALRASYFDED